ncbi:MAG: NTP transferase domain-containing protein [Thermodesulfobacteriota bacterium]|nr:NTP transferase domain-containing protein [Thermodesulfobacteriota bacterium]
MEKIKAGTAIVILAAGLGTRMKSDKAKVLHEVAGKPMVYYVLDASQQVVASRDIVVVVGCQAEKVRNAITPQWEVSFAYQAEQCGTGHAVQCALPALPEDTGDVVILCGDVPFISPRTIENLLATHREAANVVTVLTVKLDNPTGYGRIVVGEDQTVSRIVEEADADAAERDINLVNAGIYCVKKEFLAWALDRINTDNQQNELYLTDIVSIARDADRQVGILVSSDPDEVIGINSLADLKKAESLARNREV